MLPLASAFRSLRPIATYAPAFLAKASWFNTESMAPAMGQPAQGGSLPLTMEGLRGKVVVIDFWTYSCAQRNAYANQYWPAHYFIDATGRVRYFHFGEGEYDISERVIQGLLKEAGANVGGIVSRSAPKIAARTPETYLRYDRGRGFASAVNPVADAMADYQPGRQPLNGEWNPTGRWAPSRSGKAACISLSG